MKARLIRYPFFLLLLPVFFVIHGFTENYNLVPLNDAVRLMLFYIGCTLILTLLIWIVLRNFLKAALLGFFILICYFFFGAFHDLLKKLFPDTFISKYSFVLPFLALLLILVTYFIRKSKREFDKVAIYLNALFAILLCVEIVLLAIKINQTKSEVGVLSSEFVDCNNCADPDIYLIVADEYTSNKALKDKFGFDNSLFETQLKDRGFHVINNSFSNYNATAYSMASMLNLAYLKNLNSLDDNIENLLACYNTIKKNQTLLFLKKRGYKFYNYSDFNFPGQPAVTQPGFLLGKTKSITEQTLSGRISRDLWYHLVTTLKIKTVINSYPYHQHRNNNKIYTLTEEAASKKDSNPKFVYSHFVMPHYPYYFDKDGNAMPIEKIRIENNSDRKGYAEYMQFVNTRLLSLIDHIKKASSKPPVIILMGDHGFRHFKDSTDKIYYFMNLSAIHLPNREYRGFYDSSSSVNQFRTFLNNQFDQKLFLLKDSMIFINQ